MWIKETRDVGFFLCIAFMAAVYLHHTSSDVLPIWSNVNHLSFKVTVLPKWIVSPLTEMQSISQDMFSALKLHLWFFQYFYHCNCVYITVLLFLYKGPKYLKWLKAVISVAMTHSQTQVGGVNHNSKAELYVRS